MLAALRGVVSLRFDPVVLAQPAHSDDTVPTFGPQGEGLPEVLAHLKLTATERYERILDGLRRVVPRFRAIGFERVQITRSRQRTLQIDGRSVSYDDEYKVTGQRLLFDIGEATALPAGAVSEGTLLTLAILTALHQTAEPRTLLIDDFGQALHPKAQRDLIGLVRQILADRPGAQIIASTHSPDLVDALEPSEVIVFGLRDDGTTATKPLSAFPDQDALKYLRTGQLWTSTDEAWTTREGA